MEEAKTVVEAASEPRDHIEPFSFEDFVEETAKRIGETAHRRDTKGRALYRYYATSAYVITVLRDTRADFLRLETTNSRLLGELKNAVFVIERMRDRHNAHDVMNASSEELVRELVERGARNVLSFLGLGAKS